MTILRSLAAALFAGGLWLAAASPGAPPAEPRQVNGEWILAGDFHVHAFPGDGALLPADLAREARRQRLDVIAVTNHNAVWADTFIAPAEAGGVLVLPGEEITTPAFHLAVVNVAERVGWRGTLAEIAREVHAQGGAVILAHPGGPGRVETAALVDVDGVEVGHPAMHINIKAGAVFRDAWTRARTVNEHVAPIGSTDFHVVAPLGLCRTFVFARERSATGVVDAIRRGRTVACDQNSQTYGQPDLVRAVGSACADAAAARLRWPGRDQVASGLAWTGLLMFLVVGRRRLVERP